jgi:glycosyltransferase involved in cell wall biosynthesis
MVESGRSLRERHCSPCNAGSTHRSKITYMPTVSIVVPAYNCAQYLPDTINSILAQEYADWEAIIVDDGSSDDTPRVAARFTGRGIRCISQENRGVSAARNRGLADAAGEFIAFLDADDTWLPGFLRTMVTTLSRHTDAPFGYSGASLMDEAGRPLPRVLYAEPSAPSWIEDLAENRSQLPSTVLCRRSLVQESGGFDETLTSCEDWDLWLRLRAGRGMPRVVEQPLACYRISCSSNSADTERMLRNLKRVVEKHADALPAASRARLRGQALASALLTSAIAYLMRQDYARSTACLSEAARCDPAFLERDSLYYELLCGDQSKGYRGMLDELDLERNVQFATQVVAQITPEGKVSDSSACQRRAMAHLMLTASGMAWQQRDIPAMRRFWMAAVRADPTTLHQPATIRTGIKSLLGHRISSSFQHLTSTLRSEEPSSDAGGQG